MKYRTVKKRGIRWRRVALAVGGLAVLAAVATIVSVAGAGGEVGKALALLRLGAIPHSATNLQVEKVDGAGGAATWFIRFTAPSQDIERFLTSSSGLRGRKPEELGPQHMLLPQAERERMPEPERHAYFAPDERFPWFDPTVRLRGRRYVIPQDSYASHGELIVNDTEHVVFIRVDGG